MKALVYTGPMSVELRDVEEPAAADGEVLIDVAACGICGSDMHGYLGHDERRPPPLILGHEAAGTIADGPRAGERVTVNPLVTCGDCQPCREGRDNLCRNRQIISMAPRQGAFCERISIPERNLVAVPDDISFERAALVEPLSCGWHAVRIGARALPFPPGDASCLVLGGGAIGLGAALALAAAGATQIGLVDASPLRRERLAEACPFRIHGTDDPTLPDAGTVEFIIDAVGIEATREMAFKLVAPGGVIAHIGLGSASGGVDARRATLQEIAFFGCYTYTADDFRATADALFAGRLGAVDWFEAHALEDGAAMFRALHQGAVAAPKVVLRTS